MFHVTTILLSCACHLWQVENHNIRFWLPVGGNIWGVFRYPIFRFQLCESIYLHTSPSNFWSTCLPDIMTCDCLTSTSDRQKDALLHLNNHTLLCLSSLILSMTHLFSSRSPTASFRTRPLEIAGALVQSRSLLQTDFPDYRGFFY